MGQGETYTERDKVSHCVKPSDSNHNPFLEEAGSRGYSYICLQFSFALCSGIKEDTNEADFDSGSHHQIILRRNHP